MPSGSKLPLKLQLKSLLHFVFLPHFFCAFKCAHDLRQLQVFARFVELKILEPCLKLNRAVGKSENPGGEANSNLVVVICTP